MGHSCDVARDDPQFRIRLPAGLKAQVEEAAIRNGRSLNAEIVQRLETSFRAPTNGVDLLMSVMGQMNETLAKLEKLFPGHFAKERQAEDEPGS